MTLDPIAPAAAALPAPRWHYGWACVAAAAVAMTATLPGRTNGLGLVTESLLRDFGLTPAGFAAMNLWATVLGAAFALAAGPLIDRLGPRFVTAAVAGLLGLTTLAMSRLTDPAELAVALVLTRGLGQSALSVAAMAVVGKWFGRRPGGAMGLFAVLLTIGFVIAVPSLEAAANAVGWRAAWGGMGIAVAAVGVLLWVVLRDPPARVDDRVDGIAGRDDGPDQATTSSVPLAAALRSFAFWAFAAASGVFYAAFTGVTLFAASAFHGAGYPPDAPLAVPLGVLTLAGLAANAGFGLWGRRVPPGRVMVVATALLAVSLAGLAVARSPAAAVAAAGLLGFAGGGVTVAYFACWGQAFGTTHLGRIQGAAQAVVIMGSAVGPLVLGWSREAGGTYGPALWAFAAASAVAAAACAAVRVPAREAR